MCRFVPQSTNWMAGSSSSDESGPAQSVAAGIPGVGYRKARTLATQDSASDAAQRTFAEVFGRIAERTINWNLQVQTHADNTTGLQVDQDIEFPGPTRDDLGAGNET